MADKNNPQRSEGVLAQYLVGWPDVLDLRIAERSDLSGRRSVLPDGRIDLGSYGRVRVEGRTADEIAEVLAEAIGVEAAKIQVRVAEFKSQHLLLFGQAVGWQRTVPYQGQETVLDLLQRVGGIPPGGEPREVFVVRPRLAQGERPEMFKVDLKAIVVRKDMATNIRLLPFDQIYVGETTQAIVEKAIPPWLRPLYDRFANPKVEDRQERKGKASGQF